MQRTLRMHDEQAGDTEEEAQDTLEPESAQVERLKVVVRVRPLQKSEEPWGSTAATARDQHADFARENSSNVPAAPTDPSSLCIQVRSLVSHFSSWRAMMLTVLLSVAPQENHMLWEKNGQLKILAADAVFPGSAPQHKVFESVHGAFVLRNPARRRLEAL